MITILATINEILLKHGVGAVMGPFDIGVSDKLVSDIGKPDQRLAQAITNHVWPSIPTASVYHYTSRAAAESILSTGVFRLTNIEKRHSEGEIVTYCKTHHLDGYLQIDDATGLPVYRSLMSQLFYASFTDTNLSTAQEMYFWQTFAHSDGVRLRFDIQAKNPDFRNVYYEPGPGVPIPLLSDLTTAIRQRHGRAFLLQGTSRLCAFYLNAADYGREKELRMLFKRYDELHPPAIGVGAASFVEVPLNRMGQQGYAMRITEVHARTRPTMPDAFDFDQRCG